MVRTLHACLPSILNNAFRFFGKSGLIVPSVLYIVCKSSVSFDVRKSEFARRLSLRCGWCHFVPVMRTNDVRVVQLPLDLLELLPL